MIQIYKQIQKKIHANFLFDLNLTYPHSKV